MKKPIRILIVEGTAEDADLAKRQICSALEDCEFQVVETSGEFLGENELLVARRQAEQKYQSIFEHSMEGIFQSSPQGCFLDLNPAMARIYGYDSPTDMIRSVKNIAAQIYVEPEKRSEFMRLLHSQDRVENFEAKNYRKDGSIIWTSTAAQSVRDENGNVLYYEGFTEDITQRKTVEEALQKSEKRFRALTQNGLDSIVLLAADGTLLWESPAANRTLHYAPNEHLGHNIFRELMHPDDLPWTRELYARLAREPGSSNHARFRLRHGDGTWHWVEAIVTNMLNEPGINAIVANYRDIKEQKQAEIELQQRNDDLALVNALNEAINRGEELNTVLGLLRNEVQRIFSSEYTNIYLLDPARQSIKLQQYSLPSGMARKIEKVIGRAMPAVEIPVKEQGLFQSVLRSDHGMVISNPKVLQEWIGEFVETTALSSIAKSAIHKLIPQLYKILNIKSTILVPLISDGKTLGVLNISSSAILTEQDLKRIEKIGGQLTTALRRRQVEEALRESQDRYRNLVETSHDLIWSVDAQGMFTYVNRAAKEIYGYEPEELIGRPFFEIMDRQDHYQSIKNFKEAIAITDEFREVETYVQHRDGRQIILSANSIVLRDEDGTVTGVAGSSHDITARKSIENVLKEERNLLRTLIDNVPDRIYAMDRQGRKTLSNTADWKASGGKTMEDVLGKTDFETYPPALAEEFWELDEAVLESGEPVINHEEPGLDAEGNPVSVLTTKIPLRDDEGNVVGLVSIGRDITERKQAEERINDLLAFNEKILNHSPIGILTYKFSGECVFANQNAASIVGTTVEELKTQNFHTIQAWQKSGLYALVQEAIHTEAEVSADIHHLSTFGKDIWMTAHCVTFKSKEEGHVLLSITDITERKQAEEKLRQSENRYRLATKATNDVIWEWDSSTNQLLWSTNANHVFGYAADEVGPQATWWDNHLHPDDRPRVLAKLNGLINGTETIWKEEYRFLRKNGSYAYIRDRAYIERDERAEPMRMIGAMSDITARHEAEVERQALFEIMQGLAKTRDVSEFLTLIHQSIGKVIYAKNFFVILHHESSGLFEEIYSVDQFDPPAPPAKLEKSITSYIFRTGEPLLLTQARFDELVAQGEVELIGTDSTSWLGVPLKTSGRTIGVMAVQDYENDNRYSEHDKDFLTSIATQVALVIERKRVEHALTLFRAQIEQINDAIEVIDPATRRFIDVNEQACQTRGYTREEFLTLTVDDVDPIVGTLPWQRQDPLSHSGSVVFESLNRRKDGSLFPVEVNLNLLHLDRDYSLAVVRDITERKRAEEEIRRHAEETSALLETSLALTNLDLEATLQTIGKSASTLFQADGCRIFLTEPDGETLCCVLALLENSEAFSGLRIKIGQGVTGTVAASGRAEIVNDMLNDPRAMQVPGTQEEPEAIMFAPFRARGHTIGILSVRRVGGERPFEPADLELLEAFASMAASAVSNARLFEETQRQLVELHTSEERFRQLANNIQEAFWMTEAETGKELYLSPAAEAIWGRSIQTLMYEPNAFINSVLPGDRSVVLQAIEREKNGERVQLEYRIIRPDGSLRWVWDRAFPIFDASGKVSKIAGLTADITDRRQGELALIESQNRYRELFDSTPVSLWEEDFSLVKKRIDILFKNGIRDLSEYLAGHPDELIELASLVRVTDVNQAALALYQIEEKEVLLRELTQLLSKEALGHFQEEILGLLSPSRKFAWEGPDEIPQGRQLEVLVNGSIPSGYEEDWSKVIVSISDITERKRAEDALRESENKAKALLNAIPDLMFRLDKEGTILDYKADRVDLYAQSEPTLTGRKLREIAPLEFADLIDRYTQETLKSKMMQVFEYQLPIPERGLHDYEARMVASGKDEVIAIVRDITEQKRNEAETRRRADEFAALYKTARDLAAQYNLPTLLHTIVERACTLLRAPGGGVYLYDKVHGDVELVLAVGSSTPPGTRLKVGEGMAGRVAQNRELLIVDDYRIWEGRSPQFEPIPLRAVLQVPMLYGDELIGILVVEEMGESERKYTEVEAHLLSLLAEYAASAVHAARLMQETRRGAEETSALLKTSLALTNLELEATLQTIGNSAKALFTADGCRIFLMEPDGENLRCVLALQENFGAFSHLRLKVGEGVTGAVARSGQAEIVNEMQNDPRAVQIPGTPEKEKESIMFAPLKEREQTIGILSIRRAGTERPFQRADLELLEAFASMAASAVSKARLFEETQRRLSELEALYENGLAVGRLLKPSEIGDRVIETFARYLPWHHVTIRLRKEDSDDLELVSFNLPSLKEEERANAEQHFIARINKVGQGLSGWVIQTGLPLRTGNVHVHPQYIDTHAGVQSGLYMPLRIGERVIGVISVESEAPNAFTEQDERLLATLANQTAIAFENARLYEAMQKELLERKRVEDALRISETHYRALADSITDILFELDQNLHYTHWNKASEYVTGITAADAIGKPMEAIFGATKEQARIKKIYEEVLASHQPRTFETILPIGGERRSFEINAYPSMRGVSVVAKDVTERKRTETILQKRFELMEYSAHHSLSELMQKAVDEVSELTGSSIGFFHLMEADQNTLGMQTWSTNALRLFYVPAREGAHLPLDQAGVWADAVRQRRPLIQNDYESLAEKKGLPQGHVRLLREIVIPIIRNERIMAVMGIGNKPQEYAQHDLEIAARLADYAWDITERKQMEVALEAERNQLVQRVEERTSDLSRANANLARALRVKDEFLANMSHELRTPLNAILGLSESLGEQIAGPLNEKQQKYIATISESGHHLLSLINDILDLAKIDAGQITLDINKVDIRSVCQASLRMIKQLAQKKNQEVALEIDQGLGLMWADERRLKQMIVNLLGNAVKFTPENGRLGLKVHGNEEANQIAITVWDNGIGIRDDDLARLFQPFVQLDSGLAREATGTGLGLALVAQMARLHGGSVNALSEPGKGSRFTILLPWEPALAMDTASRMRVTGKFHAIQPDQTSRPTILLVEDTKEVVMMIKDYLEISGYNVFTAQDGMDGLVQARHVKPDLILMDVQMPRMDGFETTLKLRSDPDFKDTPIIALTALAMPHDRERCLEAGMDEYISKPVNLKTLVKIIQSCLFAQETRAR
jgi:PAS domain S-box-containing protein